MFGLRSLSGGVALGLLLTCGCTGESSEQQTAIGGAAGTAGTGGSSSGGLGGSAGWPAGDSGAAAGAAGTGGAAGAAGTGAAPGGGGTAGAGGTSSVPCPASKAVTLTQWTASPWVAPSSGTAETVFTLSTEKGKHYERADIDLDLDVKSLGLPYVCFLELKSPPWRYFSVCTKNGVYKNNNKKLLIYVAYDQNSFEYLTQTFTLKNNTSYSLNVVWDAKALQTTLTLTEAGGSPQTLTRNPITTSLVPLNQGLRLQVGYNTNAQDYKNGIIMPPWGWAFKNLKVTLTPGGPFGNEAPPCAP